MAGNLHYYAHLKCFARSSFEEGKEQVFPYPKLRLGIAVMVNIPPWWGEIIFNNHPPFYTELTRGIENENTKKESHS